MNTTYKELTPQVIENEGGALFTTSSIVAAENSSSLKIQCNMVDGYAEAYQQSDSDMCCIKVLARGLEPLKRMMGVVPNSVVEMLIKAVNNRTVERNYFRLYGEMMDGTITEEEFNNEIANHEEDYVLSGEEEPNEQTLELALLLSEKIKDVKDTEDLSSLFSLDSVKLDSYLQKIGSDGNLRKYK